VSSADLFTWKGHCDVTYNWLSRRLLVSGEYETVWKVTCRPAVDIMANDVTDDVTGTCRMAAFLCRHKRRKFAVRNLGWIDGNVAFAGFFIIYACWIRIKPQRLQTCTFSFCGGACFPPMWCELWAACCPPSLLDMCAQCGSTISATRRSRPVPLVDDPYLYGTQSAPKISTSDYIGTVTPTIPHLAKAIGLLYLYLVGLMVMHG